MGRLQVWVPYSTRCPALVNGSPTLEKCTWFDHHPGHNGAHQKCLCQKRRLFPWRQCQHVAHRNQHVLMTMTCLVYSKGGHPLLNRPHVQVTKTEWISARHAQSTSLHCAFRFAVNDTEFREPEHFWMHSHRSLVHSDNLWVLQSLLFQLSY